MKMLPNLVEIFNNSQHVTTSDLALTQIKKLYKNADYSSFEKPFINCVKKLFQSKQSIYFKTSCDFLCNFLKHVSKLSDDIKTKKSDTTENTAPVPATTTGLRRSARSSTGSESVSAGTKRGRQPASKSRSNKRKVNTEEEDELVVAFTSTRQDTTVNDESSTDDDTTMIETGRGRRALGPRQLLENEAVITNHDRLISSCMNVADHYMQVSHEDSRLNAVFFVCKFLSHIDALDEEICKALKSTLPKRIRDRRPFIRAQAVLASRKFQDCKMTQEGFLHHLYRDPEPMVRKALLQIMDTSVFGYEFLVDATQDGHEAMRKIAFQRLGKIDPKALSKDQLHRVIHNGLIERERQASYSFKTNTLDIWLSSLYDGLDLYKLVDFFDVINNYEDMARLLNLVHERDLDKIENNGTSTKLHHVAEYFREHWLDSDGVCLPSVETLDSKATVIWLSLVEFCKTNRAIIKTMKIRTVQQVNDEQNVSIEKILDSQERNDEVVELYERLTPDLVNLMDFLKRFIQHAHQALKRDDSKVGELEFVYQHVMKFINSFEIGDELERKTVHETIALILKENLLTGKFVNMVPPLIECLYTLIYPSDSRMMINYISELINNVRSHLEDLATSTAQTVNPPLSHSTIIAPKKTPRAKNKVKFSTRNETDQQNLEYKIATMRVDLEDLNDKLDQCIKEKDFDQAKTINNKISDLKAELNLLHDRRCSIASDVSHMSLVIESASEPNKFSSTMIGDTSLDQSQNASGEKEDIKIFKHHTNELIKCLQMYLGCLQNVDVNQVPQTMLNHLIYLSYECLDDWFKDDKKIRSLMVACNGVTALVDRRFAEQQNTITVMLAACYDLTSVEIRTVGIKSFVDVVCQHRDLDMPMDKFELFLCNALKDYGKYDPKNMKTIDYDYTNAIVEGTAKLYYHRKLDSPEILSHLILWWYHPRTHSRIKQFIGIFLPVFVEDISKSLGSTDDDWLEVLLAETFVTSVEYLHDYILGPGFNIMAASDMHSLIGFLCNLIPAPMLSKVVSVVDKKMDDLPSGSQDLLKYFKQSRNSLVAAINSTTANNIVQTPAKNSQILE